MSSLRSFWRKSSIKSWTRLFSQNARLYTTTNGFSRNFYGLRSVGANKENYMKHLCMWSRADIAASLISNESSGLQSHSSLYGDPEAILHEENSQQQTSFDLNQKSRESIKRTKTFGPYEYEFDINGYLSIEDLVKFLKHEAAFDICVIRTSGARSSYVDYFVVVSGVSNRHIYAMAKDLETLFRGQEVRGVGKHGHVSVEGVGTDNWLALDIGNIAVHFFLPETRALYELEKLWTLGPKYDDQYRTLREQEEFVKAVFVGPQQTGGRDGGDEQ